MKKSQKNLTLYLKELEKGTKSKPHSNRRKEIIKIRTEINKTRTKNIEEKKKFNRLLTKSTNTHS